jgi:hypothetical protein
MTTKSWGALLTGRRALAQDNGRLDWERERTAAVLRNRIQPEDVSTDPDPYWIPIHHAYDDGITWVRDRRRLTRDDFINYWSVVDRLSRVPGILELIGCGFR